MKIGYTCPKVGHYDLDEGCYKTPRKKLHPKIKRYLRKWKIRFLIKNSDKE